ncbi:hypothetical protein VSAK1_26325 [Vibrio mediterranei AK1]|uniref:hypothetical protein n=1 Tax=Vibrio mediterranei TaxID=689 RepID=UPI000154130F|nr:hypothetical protein [Vibrio mediterranei]EDL53759.1 hypothetical protein VSAK1_26325 [Vibrio mediterranei AK1]
MKEKNHRDQAEQIIISVYRSDAVKENLQELCEMPFDAFCILYEQACIDQDFRVEQANQQRKEAERARRAKK